MAVELKQSFVAFLDILGFSEMVSSDIGSDDQSYLSKLFRCHQNAGKIFADDPNCTVTQFSDSVVVAKPYKSEDFEWFSLKIAEYQRSLLDEGFLCRGGMAVNKHFTNGSFTFSAGLIAAYHLESKMARFPRVVISPDLMDLVFPNKTGYPNSLILEDDGLMFIDYLGATKNTKPKSLANTISKITSSLAKNSSPSVREKGVWLQNYSDFALDTALTKPRFSRGVSRKARKPAK